MTPDSSEPGTRTLHTADAGEPLLAAIHTLLDDAFADDPDGPLSEDDWQHCLGGMHVVVEQDGEPVAHAAVVARTLLHAGEVLRCGYVEGVAVRADRRRSGLGAALVGEVNRMVRGGYDVGGLGATDMAVPLYERHGWQRWRGPLAELTPEGVRPSDEDGVYVLPGTAPLDLDGELTCDYRRGDLW